MNFKKHTSIPFLIVTFFVLYSCNNKTEEQQLQINNLQRQLTAKDSIINVLSGDLDNTENKIKNNNKEISTLKNQVNAETLISFIDESTSIINTENFINTSFNILTLKDRSIMTSLWDTEIYTNKKNLGKLYPSLDIRHVINYIWSSVDRSQENLEKLITPSEKQILYSLFKNNTLYEDSGTSSIVKALLIAYTEVVNNEYIRYENDLTEKMYSQDRYSDNYWNVYKDIDSTINNFASKEVKDVLLDENYSLKKGEKSKLRHRIFFVYSFWMRRFKEENQTLVYELLKDLHQNVSKENSNSF